MILEPDFDHLLKVLPQLLPKVRHGCITFATFDACHMLQQFVGVYTCTSHQKRN